MAKQVLIIVCMLTLFSCEEKEKPAILYDRSGSATTSFEMGESYEYQVYYNLKENRLVKKNLKTDWDFALSCDANPVIVLNTSRNMLAARTNKKNLSEVTDTAGLEFKMDFPAGDKDSLAIGKMENLEYVFVIWMGYDEESNDLGYFKVKFKESAGGVDFEYSPVQGSTSLNGSLIADSRYNHVFYSCLHQKNQEIEPFKEDYDLWFTQYLHYFLEPEVTPYLVLGALLNPHLTRACVVNNIEYQKVVLSDTIQNGMSNLRDAVGYSWKFFSLEENKYSIVPNRNYIIQTQEGLFYRLAFTDFYNKDGIKGAPAFIFGVI